MITYQDLLKIGESDAERIEFVRTVIASHQNSDAYKMAETAESYDRKQNKTIIEYQKLLYTITGEAVPDNFSANFKITSSFFNRFITQQTQYLLGNGVSWSQDGTSEKLGDDFDSKLQTLGHNALVQGVGFGFWNFDHLEVFKLTEFAPLYDEEDGSLKAGVRFWQLDKTKPLRAVFYELDGYTSYIWRDSGAEVLQEKQKYILKTRETAADGLEIYDGENYPSFPIVPLWGNTHHQSELVGIRESIDAYDLIKSGFANDVDDASLIYWTINNAGGMDDVDLAQFVQRMKTVKAAVVEDDGARAESHTVEVPYASRESLLDRLRADLYEDFMALDTKNIADGAVTATQIKAAYEPLNNKTDMFEYCVLDFISGILELAGIEDEPTFTRSQIVNAQEEFELVLQSVDYLSDEYITDKLLGLLGDADKAETVKKQRLIENAERYVEEETDSNGQGAEEDGA